MSNRCVQYLRLESTKWLKLAYSLAYVKMCILSAYIYLFSHTSYYSHVLNATELSANSLEEIIALRGILDTNETILNNRFNVETLITNTGRKY